jgi:hypothetical protein
MVVSVWLTTTQKKNQDNELEFIILIHKVTTIGKKKP